VAQAPLAGGFTATRYVVWITPKGAEAVAVYSGWPVQEYAAVTRHRHGKGLGWYVGTIVKEEGFYDSLARALAEDAGIAPVVAPPAGVEVVTREGSGRKLLFVLNHTAEPKTVPVPAGKRELLSGRVGSGTLELGPLGVAVLELQ
jgi:beta-galactosidase